MSGDIRMKKVGQGAACQVLLSIGLTTDCLQALVRAWDEHLAYTSRSLWVQHALGLTEKFCFYGKMSSKI